MHFSSRFESVRIGKYQNWKVSELESVKVGKCLHWKMSELQSVRIRKCQNLKVSESFGTWYILKLLSKHYLAHFKGIFTLQIVMTLSNSDTFKL